MIGLVYDKDGWILHHVADQLLKQEGFTEDLDAADHLLYLPYYKLALAADEARLSKDRRHSALFTHLEKHPDAKRKQAMFRLAAHVADRCWAMSNKTSAFLPEWGTFVLNIPADPQFQKDHLSVGVVGHEQPFGRKRSHLLEQLANNPGVVFYYTNGRLPWEGMPKFYRQMDYILVLGDNEGGPMSVPEAVAMGRPVIAPDTGWAWEYPVIRYETELELFSIIAKLAPPAQDRWERFAATLRLNLE